MNDTGQKVFLKCTPGFLSDGDHLQQMTRSGLAGLPEYFCCILDGSTVTLQFLMPPLMSNIRLSGHFGKW